MSYPCDASDAEGEFLVSFLTLMREDAPRREYSMRDPFNAMRYVVRTKCQWRNFAA
jgi:transposase